MMRGPAIGRSPCVAPRATSTSSRTTSSRWPTGTPSCATPGLRGVIVLGQSLAIGVRALMIAANQSVEDEEQLTKRQIGRLAGDRDDLLRRDLHPGPHPRASPGRARFGSEPHAGSWRGCSGWRSSSGYLWLIGRAKDIHRVFEYHGAEHKTIAAYEHDDDARATDLIDRYPKEHVRCGTNFLIIVMIMTIFVFTLFGTPGLVGASCRGSWPSRSSPASPIEVLRLGARFPNSLVMRALMAPGLWLQKITTKSPTTPDRGGDRLVQGGPAPRGRGHRNRRLSRVRGLRSLHRTADGRKMLGETDRIPLKGGSSHAHQ